MRASPRACVRRRAGADECSVGAAAGLRRLEREHARGDGHERERRQGAVRVGAGRFCGRLSARGGLMGTTPASACLVRRACGGSWMRRRPCTRSLLRHVGIARGLSRAAMKVRSLIPRMFILSDASSLRPSPPPSDRGLPESVSAADYVQSIPSAHPQTRTLSPQSTRLVLLLVFSLSPLFPVAVSPPPSYLSSVIVVRAASNRSHLE